eukprot:Polyplicarium_translucidae@DN3379_c1_g1_i1.p4
MTGKPSEGYRSVNEQTAMKTDKADREAGPGMKLLQRRPDAARKPAENQAQHVEGNARQVLLEAAALTHLTRTTSLSNLTEEQLMAKLMGISTFDTSKDKNHSSTAVSGVKCKTKRKYRQYMNRRGGFNRPLSPVF